MTDDVGPDTLFHVAARLIGRENIYKLDRAGIRLIEQATLNEMVAHIPFVDDAEGCAMYATLKERTARLQGTAPSHRNPLTYPAQPPPQIEPT